MRIFRSKAVQLDATPHPDANMLNTVFTNLRDPRIRFFLDRLDVNNLNMLLALRNSALHGTEIGKPGMEPDMYTVSRRVEYTNDDGSNSIVYHDEHAVKVMMDIFFSSISRNADVTQDVLLRYRPLQPVNENNIFYNFLFFTLIVGSVGVLFNCDNIHSVMFTLLMSIMTSAIITSVHDKNIKTKQYISSLNLEFNDIRHDTLLNQLCQKENAPAVDWSREIQVNGKSCSIRKLMLILLTSFNDKMYPKIFSELLPKLTRGEKFDLQDETFQPGPFSLTRKVIFNIDPLRRPVLQNFGPVYQPMGLTQ